MQVTKVKIEPIAGMPRLKGYASIVLDNELAINDIKIIQARKGMCVEFPSKKFGFQNVAPLNPEIREYLQSAILNAYQSKSDTG